MPDIPPAGMEADLAAAQPACRPIQRLFPVGVRDGMPVLVAICTDHSMWQLDQRAALPQWERLPSIPLADAAPL